MTVHAVHRMSRESYRPRNPSHYICHSQLLGQATMNRGRAGATPVAALTRLTQRVKENFAETTRDLAVIGSSSSSSAAYFDTSDDRIKEISKLLESRQERDRLEGMKRIIGGMSKGREKDMEAFFAQVVKNVVAPSIEIRKLVYIYLLRLWVVRSGQSDVVALRPTRTSCCCRSTHSRGICLTLRRSYARCRCVSSLRYESR